MKIIFLQDDFPPKSFGGAGISVFELALEMKRVGHEVSVITTCQSVAEVGEFFYEGLRIFRIYSDYPEYLRAYKSLYNSQVVGKLEEVFKKVKPDIVHANNIHQHLSYFSLKLAKRHAKVVITFRDVMAFNYGKLDTKKYLEKGDYRTTWLDHIHQAGKRWNPFRNIIIKHCLGYVDCKVAISNALREALKENGIDGVRVVYNGIDVDAWKLGGEAVDNFKNKYGLRDKKVVFFNGRLSPAKGSEQVLKALVLIREKVPDTVLLVAGTGELKASPNIIFTGWLDREEMKAAYAVSDVVLMPSVCFDAFGRVNIEAMASSKPVVGTCYGGTPEIIKDGETGYIVNPFHVEEMAGRVVELLASSEKMRRFGGAGYERVEKYLNLRDRVLEYEKIYS